jgi:RNA polymerase sigma-70 factor (sigma-E family)
MSDRELAVSLEVDVSERPANHARRREALDEEQSFVALFRVEYDGLVRLAYVLTGSNELAEDVVQESFARLHERWRRPARPGAYLRRMVVNRCYDAMRRQEVEKRHAGAGRSEVSSPPSEYLLDALAHLPARQRVALVLRYYQAASEREIAEAMGCPLGTVKTLLHRGRAALKEALEP